MKILVAIATARKSDFIHIDKNDQQQLAALGYDEYGLQCNSWDQKAARDELKQILGFDKPTDSGNGESLHGSIRDDLRKIREGKSS